jgi:hypothetical protein
VPALLLAKHLLESANVPMEINVSGTMMVIKLSTVLAMIKVTQPLQMERVLLNSIITNVDMKQLAIV